MKRVESVQEFTNVSEDVRILNPDLFNALVSGRVKMLSPGQARQITGGKYHVSPKNDRTYNGIVYHSKKEARKAQELDMQVQAGEITFYLRQVPFTLPGGIVYRADFLTFEKVELEPYPKSPTYLNGWQVEVIEVKGVWTSEAKMKMKLFKATYPHLTIVIC